MLRQVKLASAFGNRTASIAAIRPMWPTGSMPVKSFGRRPERRTRNASVVSASEVPIALTQAIAVTASGVMTAPKNRRS